MIYIRETKARRLALHGGNKKALQLYERRVMTLYITLSDLIQFCLLLVALVVACHTVFKEKED